MAMIVKRKKNRRLSCRSNHQRPRNLGSQPGLPVPRCCHDRGPGQGEAVVVNAFIYRDRVNQNPVSQTQAIRKSVALSDSSQEKGKKL